MNAPKGLQSFRSKEASVEVFAYVADTVARPIQIGSLIIHQCFVSKTLPKVWLLISLDQNKRLLPIPLDFKNAIK